MRTGAQDGEAPRFKLPKTRVPEPVLRGLRGWKTDEGWLILRLHYSADPERVSEEWLHDAVQGYRGGFEGRDWLREMEIDFGAYKGEPVYPQFDPNDAVKVTKFNPHIPLLRGWDFGYRHPACVWAQLWPDGTLAYLHELYPTLNREEVPGIATGPFADLVLHETERLFPQATDRNKSAGVLDFCDPAGTQHKDASDYSSIEILQQRGIEPEWSVVGRKNRINYLRRHVEQPGRFRINPHCTLGIKAFSAAYRYPEEKTGGADREMPDLGKKVQEEPYVHIMDALEYVAACNLQIEWTPSTANKDPRQERRDVGSLAEMYLNATPADDRTDSAKGKPVDTHLEDFLSDYVGEPGDFTQAFDRY